MRTASSGGPRSSVGGDTDSGRVGKETVYNAHEVSDMGK